MVLESDRPKERASLFALHLPCRSEKVALRAGKDSKTAPHVGAMTGAIIATSILFSGAAPLRLFVPRHGHHNSPGVLNHGSCRGRHALGMCPASALLPPAGTSAATPTQASLVIESTPPGGHPEVDGGSAGITPIADHDVQGKLPDFRHEEDLCRLDEEPQPYQPDNALERRTRPSAR